MTEAAAVQIAVLTERFNAFQLRYEQDQATADEHRATVLKRLQELNNKEQQAIGALKMAKIGYAVIGIVVTVLTAIGLPKVAAAVVAFARG